MAANKKMRTFERGLVAFAAARRCNKIEKRGRFGQQDENAGGKKDEVNKTRGVYQREA